MLVAGMIFAVLAALLHVYIFVMESLTWTSERTRRTFGLSQEQALATKEMAFNQGFYNLFLAVAAGLGVVLTLAGQHTVAVTLVFVGCGSMVAAGLVLLLSSRSKARAALTQLTFPLIAVVLLLLATLTG